MSEADEKDRASVYVRVCVLVPVYVSDRGVQYRQLIPSGNAAAALLGQCAIVSFIIITAYSSSCTPPTLPCRCPVPPEHTHWLRLNGK